MPLLYTDIPDQADYIDPATRNNQPYFIDMETCETLILQTIPAELNYDPTSNWNAVASPGRNNPLYQYSGSEDTLTFTLSWYCNEEGRTDVLRKCKWLEALSKNNGYQEKPHRVKFMWGKVFNQAEWIVQNAGYKLGLSQRAYGMLPHLATQEITLKRVTTGNRLTREIRQIDS